MYASSDEDDDLFFALQNLEPCGNCGKQGSKVPCMSGCSEVFYCTKECMQNNASAHRLACRRLRCSTFDDDSDSESECSSDYDTSEDDTDEEDQRKKQEAAAAAAAAAMKNNSTANKESKKKKKRSPTKGKKYAKARSLSNRSSVMTDGETAAGAVGAGTNVDAETERRIEEKILRRLRKQEEQRISLAIEERMKREKTNWRDEEMNRIAQEVKQRIQSEMPSVPQQYAALHNNNPSQSHSHPYESSGSKSRHFSSSQQAASSKSTALTSSNLALLNANVEASSYASRTAAAVALSSPPPNGNWNNSCEQFLQTKIVILKSEEGQLGIQFKANPVSQVFDTVDAVHVNHSSAANSIAHIRPGDILTHLNGLLIPSNITTQDNFEIFLYDTPLPWIFKFQSNEGTDHKLKEQNDDVLEVGNYVVKWTNGPLGVTLKDDGSAESMPIVHRLTKKSGSAAVRENIQIGDILMAINEIDTVALGCVLTMSMLKKVQLPAKLKFRGTGGTHNNLSANNNVSASNENSIAQNSSLPPPIIVPTPVLRTTKSNASPTSSSVGFNTSYVVSWSEGHLGLTIIPGLSDQDLPVIKRVTGKGTSQGLEKAQVGDVLSAINGLETYDMLFNEEIVPLLKHSPKPIILVFQRPPPIGSILPTPPVSPALDTIHSNNTSPPPPPPVETKKDRNSSIDIDDDDTEEVDIDIDNNVIVGAKEIDIDIDDEYQHEEKVHSSPQNICVAEEIPTAMAISTSSPTPPMIPLMDEKKSNRRQIDKQSGGGGSINKKSYSLYWEEEVPLGLSIDYMPNQTGAFIKRVCNKGASKSFTDDQIGDQLIRINKVPVNEMEFHSVVSYLKQVQRPCTLYFSRPSKNGNGNSNSSITNSSHSQKHSNSQNSSRSSSGSRRSSSSSKKTYELNWHEGSLGLSLRAGEEGEEYPYINRVNGIGAAIQFTDNCVGDVLISINQTSLRNVPFKKAMDMLRYLPKPVLLVFMSRKEAYKRHTSSGAGSSSYSLAPSFPAESSHRTQSEKNMSKNASPNNHTFIASGSAPMTAKLHSSSSLSSSMMMNSGQHTEIRDDNIAQLHTPFMNPTKLSTGRRQKIVKQMRK